MGVPALAMSLETDTSHHFTYSREIDFSTAAWFSAYFGRLLLERRLPPDVDLLKVEIPADATRETPWEITRLARQHYFAPVAPKRKSWDEPRSITYRKQAKLDCEPDSDVYVLRVKRRISVTPLSLDLTARVPFPDLDRLLRPD